MRMEEANERFNQSRSKKEKKKLYVHVLLNGQNVKNILRTG